MSLFPAYSNLSVPSTSEPSKDADATDNADWLLNPSFVVPAEPEIVRTEASSSNDDEAVAIAPEITTSSEDAEVIHKKRKKEHKHHKRKKSKHKTKSDEAKVDQPKLEFTGKEDYYVDKKCDRDNWTRESLHKTSCPRYRVHMRRLGSLTSRQWHLWCGTYADRRSKRYFSRKNKRTQDDIDATKSEIAVRREMRLTEEEFALRTKTFNQRLGENPSTIDVWLEYVGHQDRFYTKITKLQLTERKMDILNRALRENPDCDQLKRTYVDLIEQTYPSFEVSKILSGLLEKDPANYILWNAQIMATQGSMARCNVPDVLNLYENCMKNMYKRNRNDDVTLKLFSSCCFFLRQAGLYEQFFALMTLALELNVNDVKFSRLQSDDSTQNTLIEYEEVVLKSGLPMNEIWLRVEKLRQNFYFLPLPNDRNSSDPQRIVFNEDIYHYIYPLTNRENSFNLTMIILRLLKIPLPCDFWLLNGVSCDTTIADFDAIEELVAVFMCRTIFAATPVTSTFDEVLWKLICEFSIGPSFISLHIGHELYIKFITEVLLLCAESFTDTKRNIFTLLWLKLERVLMLTDQHLKCWTDEKAKKLRSKIKNVLKRDENRNRLIFYVEYAQIEYDMQRIEMAENIFVTAIGQCSKFADDDLTRAEYWFTYISFVEMMMRERQDNKALSALTILALDGSLSSADELSANCTDAQKALALKKITDRLNDLTFIERNVEIIAAEQALLPDYFICMIKAKIYYLLLWKRTDDNPANVLETLLRKFPERNDRHRMVRQHLYEIYVNTLLYLNETSDGTTTHLSESKVFDVLCRALDEFPNNLFFLKWISLCDGQTWYRLRTVMSRKNSPFAMIFLIAVAQYRCKKYANALEPSVEIDGSRRTIDTRIMDGIVSDGSHIEWTYKMRVSNFLKRITSADAPTRKNSLLWRFYLRSILDVGENFERSQSTLFVALNECPWNKALYMDGTVYLPQELAHIQDLIIEKQLRIYATPEELEILRDDSL